MLKMIQKKQLTLCMLAMTLPVLSTHAMAQEDARSMGMGGTGITSGVGFYGVTQNPALLNQQKENGEKWSLGLGLAIGVHDANESLTELSDGQDQIDSLEKEVDALDGQNVNGNCALSTASGSTVCKTGMTGFRTAAGDVLNTINKIDNQPIDLSLGLNLGFAVPSAQVPFAVNVSTSGVASLTPMVSNTDRQYANAFINNKHGIDNLTIDDINSSNGNMSITGKNTLSAKFVVKSPNDALTSTMSGGALVRQDYAVSLGHRFAIDGFASPIDVGITPKISKVQVGHVCQYLNDNINTGTGCDASIQDQVDASKVSKTVFNLDLGTVVRIPTVEGLTAGFVIKNMISQDVKTADGLVSFKTTPQAIVSAGLNTGKMTYTADVALNKAKQDNLESHRIGLGAEAKLGILKLRAGVAHDFALDKNADVVSLGLGLGFLDFAVSTNGKSTAKVALQMAFRF